VGIIESILTLRNVFGFGLLGSPMRRAVDDANDASRVHRPYGPEVTPKNLPADVPIYSARGYRKRPEANVNSEGDVSLVYVPREGFDEVTSFYEDQLPARNWQVVDTHEDVGNRYRTRRFDVQKGTRVGSIAIEEVSTDLGILDHKVVTVFIDIPRWE
jgi:hypothetical protein